MDRNRYNNNDDIVEAKYSHIQDDSSNSDIMYYSIGEVAKQLNEETSVIRYWSNRYYNYLDVISCNTHRRFSELDVAKLKVIQHCKKRNMTHKQIEAALKTTEFNEEEILNKMSNNQTELAAQTIAAAFVTELESKMNELNANMLNSIQECIDKTILEHIDTKFNEIGESSANLLDRVEYLKDNIVKDDDLNKHFTGIQSEIDEIKESQNEQTEFAKFVLEQLKKQENHNKSWFKKLSLKFRLMNTIKRK